MVKVMVIVMMMMNVPVISSVEVTIAHGVMVTIAVKKLNNVTPRSM